jgi:transcriptional regulator with XRE-family HTH domain
MNQTQQTSLHVTIPADWLPLVAELVTKAGGTIEGCGASECMPMPEIPRGGKMLRALRQRVGMTQKALADAVGVPQSHISEFEKDRRAVPYKHAQKLAVALRSIPGHFMTPNAETLAAMYETFENGRKKYDNLDAMYKDLGI